jgi:2-isopropylmalate synthase
MVVYFDTTLRDGCQQSNISVTNDDRMLILEEISKLNMDYIELGWPGINTNSDKFIQECNRSSRDNYVLFGSTRRSHLKAEDDLNLRKLVEYDNLNTVCIYGKTWDMQVRDVLSISLEEGLDMIHDSISFLKKNGKTVIFDAEHYFDGYMSNPEYSMRCLEVAASSGADYFVMCDTNGGTLPDKVINIVNATKIAGDNIKLGVHMHDDAGCAVANSTLVATLDHDIMIQETINGYGERTGNANLCTVIPNITLKVGIPTNIIVSQLTSVSNTISKIMGIDNYKLPYVGLHAFSHKAGTHVNSVMKNSSTYEHIDPGIVGNERKILLSESSGSSNIIHRGITLGYTREQILPYIEEILRQIKEFESDGRLIEDYPETILSIYKIHCH